MLNITSDEYYNIKTIKYASGLFANKQIIHFNDDLSELIKGRHMFYNNSKLISFNSDLSSLKDGKEMFRMCKSMTDFNVDSLFKLENGNGMFMNTRLHSFICDLSSLKDGDNMFANTPLSLFISDLGSLETGKSMFKGCSLSAESVYYIIESLPKRTNNPTITLGINVIAGSSEEETLERLNYFAKNAFYASWDDLKDNLSLSGWNGQFLFAGKNTSITLEEESNRPLPIYAKLEEITDERNKKDAEYCTEDGKNYYNLDIIHDAVNLNGYTKFGSILEACGYYGIIPKEYLEN